MRVYLFRDGAQTGPYTLTSLRIMVEDGRAAPEDWTWHEGAAEWAPLADLPGWRGPRPSAVSAEPRPTHVPAPAAPPSARSAEPPPPADAPPADAAWAPRLDPVHPGELAPRFHPAEPVRRLPRDVRYADVPSRAIALLADTFILIAPSVLLKVAMIRLYADPDIAGIAQWVVGAALGLLYDATMLSGPKGATFGKQLIGIRVVAADGQPLGFGQAAFRHIAKYISWAFFFLGYVWAAFDARKRTWHDLLAGTVVIERG